MAQACDFATIDRPGFAEPPPAPWGAVSRNFLDDDAGTALAALAGTRFDSRFFSWAGLSGHRYVFSVYPASSCPAFCNAILLAAAHDHTGRRRVIFVRDTGAFPEPVVARAQRELRAFGPRVEFHLHLLPSSQAEREATIADLAFDALKRDPTDTAGSGVR